MKKTLTAIALFAALATGATSAEANLHSGHNEGLQNYYYYFGAPCCNRPAAVAAPCAAPAPCGECCAPQAVFVPMEQECCTRTCDPCGSSFNVLNPFSYFG